MTQAAARSQLLRMKGAPLFASVYVGTRIAGIGLALQDDWLGLFSIATHPEYARRGVATRAVHALAERAAINGANDAFLQVEEGNVQARNFYDKAGFTAAYRYHYRTLL